MSKVKSKSQKSKSVSLEHINLYAAGIDIGSRSHFVAVSPELSDKPVREFGVFTPDLKKLIEWLKSLGITSVAMESTGVYWISLFEMLEASGFDVLLVNASQVKSVPGRKSDVLDCQWIQQLHTYGLLRGSFRPENDFCVLRSFVRQRTHLVEEAASYKLRMQKALTQMNIHIHNVISDICGDLGMTIIRAIVGGNYDPKSLASNRTGRYRSSLEVIEKSLEGNYREEHVFSLKQSLSFFDFCHEKIKECDIEIEKLLVKTKSQENIKNKKIEKETPKKRRKNELHFASKELLKNLTGVDLCAIDGLDEHSVLKILSETGTDMSKWKTVGHFISWLSLSPGTKISGGKKLSSRTKPFKNRASHYFKIAANTLLRSDSSLGAFYRRMRTKLGAPKAITAAANKIAKIFYIMIRTQKSYRDLGADYYDQAHKNRVIVNLSRRAEKLGLMLIPKPILDQ